MQLRTIFDKEDKIRSNFKRIRRQFHAPVEYTELHQPVAYLHNAWQQLQVLQVYGGQVKALQTEADDNPYMEKTLISTDFETHINFFFWGVGGTLTKSLTFPLSFFFAASEMKISCDFTNPFLCGYYQFTVNDAYWKYKIQYEGTGKLAYIKKKSGKN